jgi:hypothetical protein
MVAKKSTANRAQAGTDRLIKARRARPARRIDTSAADARPAPSVDAAVVSQCLWQLLEALQRSMSAVIVSVEALRRQDADADSDIAVVLQQHVGDQLDIAIERLAELIVMFDDGRTDTSENAMRRLEKEATAAP